LVNWICIFIFSHTCSFGCRKIKYWHQKPTTSSRQYWFWWLNETKRLIRFVCFSEREKRKETDDKRREELTKRSFKSVDGKSMRRHNNLKYMILPSRYFFFKYFFFPHPSIYSSLTLFPFHTLTLPLCSMLPIWGSTQAKRSWRKILCEFGYRGSLILQDLIRSNFFSCYKKVTDQRSFSVSFNTIATVYKLLQNTSIITLFLLS